MHKAYYTLILFASAFLFFSIFTPMGSLPSDTDYSVATAKSIFKRGTLAVSPSPGIPDLKPGLDGRLYSKYGVGYSLLFTPAIALAELAGHVIPRKKDYMEQFILSFTNTTLASIIVITFFWLFITLGYSIRVSLMSVLCIAAGSILLPYSKIVHAEIPTFLLLLLFLNGVAKRCLLDGPHGLIWGLTASALVFIKAGNAIFAVVIAIYGILLFIKKRGTITGLIIFLGTGIIAAGIMATLNIARFGDVFNFGYGAEQNLFNYPLHAGLTGFLFSPSKSIFIFSPLVIACIAALPRLYKKFPLFTIITLSMSVGAILFNSKWHDWHGGWCWGPRLIIPSLLLLHCAIPEALCIVRKNSWRRTGFVVLLLFAIGINLLGTLVWYQQIFYFHRDYSSIRYSHPVIAAKLLKNKLENKPEIYSCNDFGWPIKNYSVFQGNIFRNDSLDFSSFEKFQGLATMWDGVRRNFHFRFLWIVPIVLLLASSISFYYCWKTRLVT